jgi:hypothetical protein
MPRTQAEPHFKQVAVLLPGCAVLGLGFLAVALFFERPVPSPEVAPAVEPRVAPAAAPSSAPILWTAPSGPEEGLRLDVTPSSAAGAGARGDAPKPVIAREVKEMSCPTCGGAGRFSVKGEVQTCPTCGGSGRCREKVGGAP